MGSIDKTVDRIFNFLYTNGKTNLYLLFIILIGFILRVIAAINLAVHPDDAAHATFAVNFLNSGKLEIYHQSASLWHLVTDMFFKLFGTSQFTSRFPSVLFGTLSIILIFLLTKQFFKSRRVSLIAAFLLAFSPFYLKNTLAEQDIMTFFFILLGTYLFILGLEKDKTRFFVYAGFLFGLGVMTKLYTFFFIPGIYLYSMHINRKETKKFIDKKLVKRLIIFTIIIGLFFIPALTHNYLLYKDKGILDFQFTRVLGLGGEKAAQFYSYDAGWGAKPDYLGFFLGNSRQLPWSNWPSSLWALTFILYNNPFVFIFGILGLISLFRKKNNYFYFFILFLILPFFYLASMILLSKHYLFLLIFLIPCASYSLNSMLVRLKKIRLKHLFIFLFIFYIIFLGFNITHTHNHFYGESGLGKLMDYKEENIKENSLVVVDSRIYRANNAWMFNDKYYLESAHFSEVVNNQEGLPGEVVDLPVYYIECVADDCEWGTIKNQPEFNASMEQIVSFFKENAVEKTTFKTKQYLNSYFPFSKDKGQDYYRVYEMTLPLKPAVLDVAYSTHKFWLYPVGYDRRISEIFDDYETYNSMDNLLNKSARLIQYIAIILTFVSIIYLIVIFLKRN